MDKVLNRPLFRKVALKKGYIKPIKARTGEFIGPQQFRPPAVQFNPPAVIPKQGMLRQGLGSLFRYGLSLPFFAGAD